MGKVFGSWRQEDRPGRIMTVGCILVLLFSILPVVTASGYSVLIEDDYWHGCDVGVFGGGVELLYSFA